MSFGATLTRNAFDLHQWHEMESVVHSQFGTIDNPVLIFTSDSSWRIVICMGPGIEDDSNSHEKIFYMVREGPINRCQVCGQCFKIVRLKDEFNEQQDYYTLMFSTVSHFDVAEEDMNVSLISLFGDRPSVQFQSVPATNVYIHVNADEADRILVDPAYKLERLKEANEKLHAMHNAYAEIDRQLSEARTMLPTQYGRDNYETWYKIELAINKFDRIFNRVERFQARKFNDPENHERREKRMQDRMKQRWTENFTYFLGDMTEEEQQYRDYFQTDIELDPEDEFLEEIKDRQRLAVDGQFDPKLYDFIDTGLHDEVHETYDDIVEDKIFKFKYRQNADPPRLYKQRQQRVVDRFYARLPDRDPSIGQDLATLFLEDEKFRSPAALLLEHEKFGDIAVEKTKAYREYMVKEAVQQYKDYYEDDAEEQKFFEYLDNLPNRDQIRFMEIFEDFTINKTAQTGHILISKREFNPELSAFSNLLLDLVDFKDRVRPLAQDIARLDVSRKYQPKTLEQIKEQERLIMENLEEYGVDSVDLQALTDSEKETLTIDEGYSSIEAATQDFSAAVEETADEATPASEEDDEQTK